MQALYATPAWACCFYVFMFFTLFLWEGWWIFFSCIIKGVEKKTRTFENHSDETVSPAKNMLEGWFIWKVGSIALSGVQKHFCIISGSRDISKTIWGIRFQEFEIMNNLEIWYQRDSCLISLAMNISEGWDISHFKGDILRRVLSSNPFPYNIREPKYKQNNMEHQISKH